MLNNFKYTRCFIFLAVWLPGLSVDAQYRLNLGRMINSKYDEIKPVLTSDAKYLYFVRKNHPENTFGTEDSEDIWYSVALSPNDWSKAKRLPNLNVARYNGIVAISKDDQRFLINGVFSPDGKEFLHRGLSVVSRSSNGETGLPVPLEVQGLANMDRGLNTTGTWNADENHIILALSEKYMDDKFDLYQTFKKADGTWGRPEKILSLSSGASEEAPCFSNDGKTLYFSSDRAEAGKFDIYESTRQEDSGDKWSEPVLAKFPLNTIGYDSYPEFDEKNELAYLSSDYQSIGGLDLFCVDLLGRPLALNFTGKLLDDTGQPYKGPFDVKVNGRTRDSLQIVPDSGIFRTVLRANSHYEIMAHVNGTLPVIEEVTVEYANKSAEFVIHFSGKEGLDELAANGNNYVKVGVIGEGKGKKGKAGFDANGNPLAGEEPDETGNPLESIDGKGGQSKKGKGKFGKDRKTGVNGGANTGTDSVNNDGDIKDPLADVNVEKNDEGVSVKQSRKTGKTVGFIFDHILFPFDGDAILPESQDNLDYMLKFMQDNPELKVQIEGHTSSEGDHAYNEDLSLRRARAIQTYLKKNKIAGNRMKIRGVGPDQPFADNSTLAGRKKNRRVEVNIL